MPNTFAHLGINGILSRIWFKKSDLVFIYIGAILPDIPWIMQRIISTILPSVNPYDLRLYSIVNSTFLASLFLCLVIAVILKNSKHVFSIFALGSILHLLLDSLETKWGNGVHFLAPFNWDLVNIGFFWPESVFAYSITAFGFVYIFFYWKDVSIPGIIALQKSKKRVSLFSIGVLIYFLLPFLFMHNAESSDNHFVKTLREKENRLGKYFEIDRGNFVDEGIEDKFVTSFNEELSVANINLNVSETMSVRAKFRSVNEIEILEYHLHSNRDIFSYIGLLIIAIILFKSIFGKEKIPYKSNDQI